MDSKAPSSTSRDLCRCRQLIQSKAEGAKITRLSNWERKVSAGGIQKWLGKVTSFEWPLSLGNSQEGAGGSPVNDIRGPALPALDDGLRQGGRGGGAQTLDRQTCEDKPGRGSRQTPAPLGGSLRTQARCSTGPRDDQSAGQTEAEGRRGTAEVADSPGRGGRPSAGG